MNYERDTKLAYAGRERAAAYHDRQTRSWTWSRVSTMLEGRAVRRLLKETCGPHGAALLDVPCGTGIAASMIGDTGLRVTASDISMEMMRHARVAYTGRTRRFVCADLTHLPLPDASFDCVLTLGFMHRVPPAIRRRALAELARVSRGFVLLSCSVDSTAQRVKHRVLLTAMRHHVPAPSPVTLSQLESEFAGVGLTLCARVAVARFLSSESLFLLQKI